MDQKKSMDVIVKKTISILLLYAQTVYIIILLCFERIILDRRIATASQQIKMLFVDFALN